MKDITISEDTVITKLIECVITEKDKCSRREKERLRTQRFILVYLSTRATSSLLPTSKKFH